MEFKAFKMDGLGNDFVIIDQRHDHFELTNNQIKKICSRNFIGCDQLIFIEPDSSADASLRFFNSDGGESGACGNGTRCVANLISNEKNNKSIILIFKFFVSISFDKGISSHFNFAFPISVVTIFFSKISDFSFPDSVFKIIDLLFFSFEIKFATHLVPFPHAPDSPPSELKNFKFASAELSVSINIS